MSCEGTGCYVRGAAQVRQAVEDRLNVGPGETTADGTDFRAASICLGACDLGPLVEVEGRLLFARHPREDEHASSTSGTKRLSSAPFRRVGDNLRADARPPQVRRQPTALARTAEELYARVRSLTQASMPEARSEGSDSGKKIAVWCLRRQHGSEQTKQLTRTH